ncbi:SGNH/GDSL hydrolase family protein [Streptomyces goshikiensis]|uniref:SGNH/GDSL hydrolase family protein n=1 Tax=Streptomyces goshikiensis TaxID=1942 RepID=UPI003724AFCC
MSRRTRFAAATATAAATLAALVAAATAAPAAPAAPAAGAAPAGATLAVLNYVALGDSYSAGAFVRPWTDDDGCGRSTQNYPQQAARRLKVRLTDVTCSGAEVRAGLLAPQTDLTGPPSVPPENGWAPRPAQVRALAPTTDLVTLGVGGNSIGFTDVVTRCLEQGLLTFGLGRPCSAHYTGSQGAAALDRRFAELEADFAAALKDIRARAPRAKVAVVGYPAVVDDNTGCAWGRWQQLGTIAKADMPWLDSLERRLNTMLRDQARRAGASYVDTYAGSAGHGVCASGEGRWMYGIKDTLTGGGTQSDPPSGLCRSIPARGEACTVIHPNLRGVTHQAELVTQALIGLGAGRA